MAEKDHSQIDNGSKKENLTSLQDPSPEFNNENKISQTVNPKREASAPQQSFVDGSEPPGNIPTAPQIQPIPEDEARTWAMLAHLSVLLNLFSGFLGGIAAIVIYFIYKDRSRFVAYHAMQAFIFQAITWIGSGVIGGFFITIGSFFGILIIPLLCLIPGILIFSLIPISVIYGIIGAVKVNNGEDFRYWEVGDWVRNILEPEMKKYKKTGKTKRGCL